MQTQLLFSWNVNGLTQIIHVYFHRTKAQHSATEKVCFDTWSQDNTTCNLLLRITSYIISSNEETISADKRKCCSHSIPVTRCKISLDKGEVCFNTRVPDTATRCQGRLDKGHIMYSFDVQASESMACNFQLWQQHWSKPWSGKSISWCWSDMFCVFLWSYKWTHCIKYQIGNQIHRSDHDMKSAMQILL